MIYFRTILGAYIITIIYWTKRAEIKIEANYKEINYWVFYISVDFVS